MHIKEEEKSIFDTIFHPTFCLFILRQNTMRVRNSHLNLQLFLTKSFRTENNDFFMKFVNSKTQNTG